MFATIMTGGMPPEEWSRAGINTVMSHRNWLGHMAALSRRLADRVRDASGNTELQQQACMQILDVVTAPDVESMRLMTDDELESLLMFAKIGCSSIIYKSMFMSGMKSMVNGKHPDHIQIVEDN